VDKDGLEVIFASLVDRRITKENPGGFSEMRTSRIVWFSVLIITLFWLGESQRANAGGAESHRVSSGNIAAKSAVAPNALPSESGVKEAINVRYQKRYEEWKSEFLSTEIGRAQWDMYEHNPHFVLTITVSKHNSNGAGSSNYKWNENGELVGATITLGSHIDEGYPNSIYYPVMNSLESFEDARLLNGNTLAAAKIAHEFGHVIQMSATREETFQLQSRLVPAYNKIFLSNGHNVQDPRLLEMAKEMGGDPVAIWADHEYWGEANAMLFLRDRVANERFNCRLFGKIRQTVATYAKNYEERFAEIAKSRGITYACSWH
jgi:hypothetical protein